MSILLKIKIQNTKFTKTEINSLLNKIQKQYKINKRTSAYFVFSNKVSNSTYNIEQANINILMKNGNIIDITSASDQFNIDAVSKKVEKYFLCYPSSIL